MDADKFGFYNNYAFFTREHMATKTTLLTVEQARDRMAKYKGEVQMVPPAPDTVPPCPGATIHVCQNGDNAGKRYWALKQSDHGWNKSTFLGWIDEPSKTLKQLIDEHGDQLKELSAAIKALKKKAKETSEESS